MYDELAPTSATNHRVMSIDGADIDPVKSVHDLGIYIDADLVMLTHVQCTVSRCFSALCQLRQILRSVPPDTMQSLIVSPVISRLDYGNSILVSGQPSSLPSAPSTVGVERSGTADLPHEIRGPHHRRACQSSLAAHPTAD